MWHRLQYTCHNIIRWAVEQTISVNVIEYTPRFAIILRCVLPCLYNEVIVKFK